MWAKGSGGDVLLVGGKKLDVRARMDCGRIGNGVGGSSEQVG